MVSDAIGTVAGAALGTSTVTSFIESAAGVEQGGRTGLTGLVVAVAPAEVFGVLEPHPARATASTVAPTTAAAARLMRPPVPTLEWRGLRGRYGVPREPRGPAE